jgi:hypothetical protein
MSPPGEYAVEITVAIRAGGEAVAVWEQSGAGEYAIGSATFGTWSQSRPFPAYFAHDLVVSSAGDVLAEWDDYAGIYAAVMSAGTTTWGPVSRIAPVQSYLQSYSIGFDRNRALVAVWGGVDTAGKTFVSAARLDAGASSWQQAVTQAVDGNFADDYEAGYAIDEAGNAVAAYMAPEYSAVGTVVLDAAAPQLRSLSFRQAGHVGEKLRFAAEPFDISPVTFRWFFGDRHRATGAAVTHAYKQAGRYAITLIATDAAGHSITVARTSVRVSPRRG